MAKSAYKTLFISAKTKENIEELKETLYEDIKELHVKIYPYNNFLY
jgi:GTP-binding protein HflX